jgi:hypothetical protein
MFFTYIEEEEEEKKNESVSCKIRGLRLFIGVR